MVSATLGKRHPRPELKIQAVHGELTVFFGTCEGANLDDFWQEICQATNGGKTNVTKEAYIEAFRGEVRNYDSPLIHRVAQEHLNEGSDGVHLPERSVHF